MNQPDDSTSEEFENYLSWIRQVKEETGLRGVAKATYAFFVENRELRAHVRRMVSTTKAPSIPPQPRPTAPQTRQNAQRSKAGDLAQGEQKREQIYNFLVSYLQQHQQAPTHREISEAVGLSKARVSKHLDRLERDGRLSRARGVDRGITLK